MAGVSRFDCFPSDFLNGIFGLSADEIAAYTVVIMLQYDRGQPVAYRGREKTLAAQAGMTRARLIKAIEALIQDGKLEDRGGALANRRAEKMLENIAKKIENLQKNSMAGGSATRDKFSRSEPQNPNLFSETGGPFGPQNGPPKEGHLAPNARARSPSPVPLETNTTSSVVIPYPAGDPPASIVASDDLAFRCMDAAGIGRDQSASPGLLDASPIVGLIRGGFDLETEILPALRTLSTRPKAAQARTWRYLVAAISEQVQTMRGVAATAAAVPKRQPEGPTCRTPGGPIPRSAMVAHVRRWSVDRYWPASLGPEPDRPGTYAPPDVRHEALHGPTAPASEALA